jgi:hypothetical protein
MDLLAVAILTMTILTMTLLTMAKVPSLKYGWLCSLCYGYVPGESAARFT